MAWLPKTCVIVPIDFSDRCFAAAREARELVEDPAHIHLVHVLSPMHVADPGVVWDTVDDSKRSASVRQSMGDTLGAEFAGSTIHVRLGSPAAEIVDLAAEIGAQLIVMPSHGRTGLARFAIGSVAEKVVRLSRCPVLVLRQ